MEIDVELLKSEIKKTYASVSEEPEKDFIFPTGAWAEDLDYPAELANVPESAVESFCRRRQPMGNGSARTRRAGARPQLRRGHSTDSLIAAQMVGEQGRVSGIDMTHEMLAKARAAASEMGAINVDFVEGEAEQLPSPTRASTL